MMHEQIRQAMKEFQSENVNFSFTDKEISPFDRIHLTVHDFVPPDTLQSAKVFLSRETFSPGQSSPAAESSTIL
jgi:lipoate synthase